MVQYPVEGSCQCGSVRYQLLRAPRKVVACHCKECQKLSTSAFSITAMVDVDALKFSGDMAEWSRVAESGNINEAYFVVPVATAFIIAIRQSRIRSS